MSEETQKRIRATIGSVYAFVQSREVNRALSSVSIEQLMVEQILRNGSTDNAKKYETSSSATTDENNRTPATQVPINTSNFVSGTDAYSASKIEQLNSLQSELNGLIDVIKNIDPIQILDPREEDENLADPIALEDDFETVGEQ